MEGITRSLGQMIGGNQLQVATVAARESQEVSAVGSERGEPEDPEIRTRGVRLERSPEEGVPQARRPRLRQVYCETCCLRVETYHHLLKCCGCRNWVHEGCLELLDIGTSWHADMCLTCKFKVTRMLRVVSAVEFGQGRIWNQDEWFETLQHKLSVGTGYGISGSKDMNELELFMARAIMNGLRYRKDLIAVTPTDGVGGGSEGSVQGGPTPIAAPAVPQEEVQPDGASRLRPVAEWPQQGVMDSGREVIQNAGVSDLAGRTGVRIERDVRDHEGQQGSGPRSRAESYHSTNSAQRDQRVAELERKVERFVRELETRGEGPPHERPQQHDVSF